MMMLSFPCSQLWHLAIPLNRWHGFWWILNYSKTECATSSQWVLQVMQHSSSTWMMCIFLIWKLMTWDHGNPMEQNEVTFVFYLVVQCESCQPNWESSHQELIFWPHDTMCTARTLFFVAPLLTFEVTICMLTHLGCYNLLLTLCLQMERERDTNFAWYSISLMALNWK